MASGESVNFIECGTINVSYNIMGIATISYTIITSDVNFSGVSNSITVGNKTFSGVVMSANLQPLPQMTEDSGTIYYSITVSMLATT